MTKNILLVSVDRQPELLRQLLRHYSRFGFDKILISIFRSPYTNQAFIKKIELLASEFGVSVVAMQGYQAMKSIELHQHIIANYCTKGDWLFMVNVDEFHQYSRGLQKLVQDCVENGIDHITGHLLDRLGPHGDFPVIDEEPVWDCFPIAARLTKNILIGSPARVVAIETGSYDQANYSTGEADNISIGNANIFVHLFKWDSTVFERSRYDVWKNSVEENPSFIIPLRFLRYSKNNSPLNINDDRLEAFWPAYSRCSPIEGNMPKDYQNEEPSTHFIDDVNFRIPLRNPDFSLKYQHGVNFLFDSKRNWATRISERGVKVWNLCDGKSSVREIYSNLNDSFDAESKIERGLQVFVRGLMQNGALV